MLLVCLCVIVQVVEYLVGDGPNNRYALICRKCHSHNGMALRDEFEYLTFRCAYCYHVNKAFKTKPTLHPNDTSDRQVEKMADDKQADKMVDGVATVGRNVARESPVQSNDNINSPEVYNPTPASPPPLPPSTTIGVHVNVGE